MRIREFCEKYNVPEQTVYEASFTIDGDRLDFDPVEMAKEVRKLVNKRLKVHRAHVERSERILKNLEGV